MAKQSFEFCRRRAKEFALSGHSAIAVDYTIRGLGTRPRNRELLELGASLAGAVEQQALRDKCVASLERLGVDGGPSMPPMPKQDFERLTVAREDTDEINAVLEESGAGELLECRAISGYGRGLVALQDIPKRSPLFAERPLFAVRRSASYCAQCLKPLSSGAESSPGVVVPCGGEACAETYCSVECRLQAGSEGHTQLCQDAAFRELVANLTLEVARETRGNASVALSMLVVIQMIVRGMALGEHPLQQEGVADLSGAVTYEPASTFDNTGALTVQISEAIGAHLFLEDVLTLFALVQSNEFNSPAGSAVFRALSMANHSCVPNAVVDFENTGHAVLSAATDIRAGDQVLIDYTAGVAPRLPYARRKELLSQRHFECYCAKCVRRQ